MANSSTIQRPKGTQDLLGPAMSSWHSLEALATQVLLQAGYNEIRPPILEHTELFMRGVGEGTDIVSKEMFAFERSDRSFCLRPEGTAGVVRAYIENGLHRWPKPVKLFYMGPMFRYERPQEGRQRQFHQLGCEVLGLDTPACDAEVIAMAMAVLNQVGVSDCTLHINNVGEGEDRHRFATEFKAVVAPHLPNLCNDCTRRFEQNPLRMLDCKVPTCNTFYNGPVVSDFLETFRWNAESESAFEETVDLLRRMGHTVAINRRLVRGLDYYTRTVFEIVGGKGLGAQNTLCGGGRYNGLVETLGGPTTPAIGWAFGLERLAKVAVIPDPASKLLYVVHDDLVAAMTLAAPLRAAGWQVELDTTGRPFGKQLQAADKRKALAALILGDTERQTGSVQLKCLADSQQTLLSTQSPSWPDELATALAASSTKVLAN
jgi:histidyl-tRNA synthetase